MRAMANMLEDVKLEVNGFTFNALAIGPKDGDIVLLLHGFPQFADSWVRLMRSLAERGFRAVAVDQRGYSPGARPQDVQAYVLEALVADAFGLADALGVERFHLVGHDWGGAVAWAAAARLPARLHSLAVLSTPHLDAFAEALAHEADQKRKSLYMALFRAPAHLAEKVLLAFGAKALRMVYQGKVSAAQVKSNVRRLQEAGALTAALNWYRANSLAVGLGPIHVPTLYLWGEQDTALGERAAVATGKYIAAPYQFGQLPGASHWLLEDVPEQVRNSVLAHLETHRHTLP